MGEVFSSVAVWVGSSCVLGLVLAHLGVLSTGVVFFLLDSIRTDEDLLGSSENIFCVYICRRRIRRI